MGRASIVAKLTEKLGCAPTEVQIQNYKVKKAAKKAAEALAAEAAEALAAEAAAPLPPAPAAPAAKLSKQERKNAAAAAAAAGSSSSATPPPAKKQKTAAATAPSTVADSPSPGAALSKKERKKAAKVAAAAAAEGSSSADLPPAAPAAVQSKKERKKAAAATASPPPAKKPKTATATAPSAAAAISSPGVSTPTRGTSAYHLYLSAEIARLKASEAQMPAKEIYKQVRESWQTSEQNPKNGGTALAEQVKAAKAAKAAERAAERRLIVIANADDTTPARADRKRCAPTDVFVAEPASGKLTSPDLPKARKSPAAKAAANAAATAAAYSQLCCTELAEMLRVNAPQVNAEAIVGALRARLSSKSKGFTVRALPSLLAARGWRLTSHCMRVHARACTSGGVREGTRPQDPRGDRAKAGAQA